MMNKILYYFKFNEDKEDHQIVIDYIKAGVEFKETNIWILIFAIFIASLGLNVNSTAVIIGAMLISPLMGPIMGMGLGFAINDVFLLRKSFTNYLLATAVALATSTVYFLLTPLNEAHSEILARTEPNIYDVLIALVGGLAGILATTSRQKGNVITGVAIATALMPPLCTAGYGLATWKPEFFHGAFYLFIINTVFIGLATFITIRLLKYPYVNIPVLKDKTRTRRILLLVAVSTVIPSLYFGYDIVQQTRFKKKVAKYIEMEAAFPNNYMLNKIVDAKNKTIILTFGGEEIDSNQINTFKAKLKSYDLSDTKVEIKQGFSYLSSIDNEETSPVTKTLIEKEAEIKNLKFKHDSIVLVKKDKKQIFYELKALRPDLKSLIIETPLSDNLDNIEYVIVSLKGSATKKEKQKLEDWLKTRLKRKDLKLFIQK